MSTIPLFYQHFPDMIYKKKGRILLSFFSLLVTVLSYSQDTTSSDGLLVEARKAAFDNNDYTKAKAYLYKALKLSPDYADVKIFLGRIYTWTKNYDSGRYYFSSVLKANAQYEDASVALADLEYWNDDNSKALQVVNEALVFHPQSQELLIRKTKILTAMRRYTEAQSTVEQLLKINRNNSEARSLANRIKESAAKNSIGISYDYVSFDKQFADPWHLASFDYTRTTGIGSITGRINYANRFKNNGLQYELEAYPHISKTFYSYISIGYSDSIGVFPHWRGGFSLYANLPKSFEGELGIRYLQFSGDPTLIYTAYLGKYYKSWLFSGRTYLTPGTFTKTISASYSVSARYYYGSADDVIGASFGYGISPDDRSNSIQLDDKIRLISYKAGLSFKKKISRFSVIGIDGSWYNQEYLPQTKGNQYQFSIGWLLRF
jgi:YaiO family outer membrane protein